MFLYPVFDKTGKKVLSKSNDATSAMQDIIVYALKKDSALYVEHSDMESACLLVKGRAEFSYNANTIVSSRNDFFTDPPFCVHISKSTVIKITALEDSEILVQSTQNPRKFEPTIYDSTNIRRFVSCKDKWENTAIRDVVTIFDYSNAPYSNMVIGEVYARQGRWWSYIPHSHPQPEVYYYRFNNPHGFGACFIGETAYTIKDGSVGIFEGGFTHAQVTAPGYPMYCCWMIRHLDGNPWRETRTDDPNHSWLLRI
ncbi:MAG: 5-deoxy-glucuronate isomerase [Christensenellaceae bacterium]|jgi:5-deoxy-glucuronate isomerase|nr:5-deoxy-glucuronate isomerase [Christensenellaceae bacterium]